MKPLLVVLLASLALSACAPVEVVSPEDDAQAKALEPRPHRALIYTYRGTGSASPNTVARVYVRPLGSGDEARILSLDEQSYGVADIPAGPVKLTVVVTRGMDTGSYNTTIDVGDRAKLYIEVRTNPIALVSARQDPRLFVRSPDVGAAAVSRARLRGVLHFGPPAKAAVQG